MSTTRSTWVAILLAVAVAAAAGLLVGRLWPREPATPVVAVPPRVTTSSGDRPVRVGLDPALREEIRGMLRDEVRDALADLGRGDPAGAPADDAEAVDDEPSAASVEAFQRGHDLIEHARRSGRWTEDDARAMRVSMTTMTDAQKREILTTLFPAVSRGEVKPDFRGPLL